MYEKPLNTGKTVFKGFFCVLGRNLPGTWGISAVNTFEGQSGQFGKLFAVY